MVQSSVRMSMNACLAAFEALPFLRFPLYSYLFMA